MPHKVSNCKVGTCPTTLTLTCTRHPPLRGMQWHRNVAKGLGKCVGCHNPMRGGDVWLGIRYGNCPIRNNLSENPFSFYFVVCLVSGVNMPTWGCKGLGLSNCGCLRELVEVADCRWKITVKIYRFILIKFNFTILPYCSLLVPLYMIFVVLKIFELYIVELDTTPVSFSPL